MKLIHLSDLHLGKHLCSRHLIEDQEYILLQILRIVKEEKAQAVLLCGDIYDRSTPPTQAVTLFDEFLSRLAKLQVQVLVISGNHDSPERLAFGNRLMKDSGIHLSPVYNGSITPLRLSDQHGTVNFWLLPFIRPSDVRRFFPDENIGSYTDACRVAVENMEIDPTQRNVLLTHQFVTGAATCGEEEISVGGTDNVDASVFDAFDYVALGHIHGPQNIGSNRIRYCGTPIKYSFSEVSHYKSVTVVELGAKGELTLHTVGLTPLHDVRIIRGSFAELTDKAPPESTDDYLTVVLTDEEDVPEAYGRLSTIYPHILHLTYDNTRTRADQSIGTAEDMEKKSPLELFEELYNIQNNRPMSDEQRAFVQELMDSISWGDQG